MCRKTPDTPFCAAALGIVAMIIKANQTLVVSFFVPQVRSKDRTRRLAPGGALLTRELNRLQVIAWDQPCMAVAPVNLSLPPSIVLVTEDGEDISLAEAEFFRNCGLIHIQSAR